MRNTSSRNRASRKVEAPSSPTQKIAVGAIATALFAAWLFASKAQGPKVESPRIVMDTYRDVSESFASQWPVMLGPIAEAYDSLGNDPVSVRYSAVGSRLELVGSAVTTNKRELSEVLKRPPDPDPSASRIDLGVAEGASYAEGHPDQLVVEVVVTDGEASNYPALEAAARRLARQSNACLLVLGVIPSARRSCDAACRSLGERYLSVSTSDANRNFAARVAHMVSLTEVRRGR